MELAQGDWVAWRERKWHRLRTGVMFERFPDGSVYGNFVIAACGARSIDKKQEMTMMVHEWTLPDDPPAEWQCAECVELSGGA